MQKKLNWHVRNKNKLTKENIIMMRMCPKAKGQFSVHLCERKLVARGEKEGAVLLPKVNKRERERESKWMRNVPFGLKLSE